MLPWRPAGLKAALVAPEGARRVPKGAGDVVPVGPALLDQADYNVCLGHPIVDRVLDENDAREDDDVMSVPRPGQATVV